jgi:tellurium resistance protein TerD
MPLKLEKGQRLNLNKEAPSLKNLDLCLGWDVGTIENGKDFDLDATVFLLNDNNKLNTDGDVVFYNQDTSVDGSTFHNGDNLTGDGDGDDEIISINIEKISQEVKKIICIVTIHEAMKREQKFGMVNNAYIRLVNKDTNEEIAKFDLSEDSSISTSVIFGELNRTASGDWSFNPIGEGDKKDLRDYMINYGASV